MTGTAFVKHIMRMYPGTLRDDVQKMVQIVFTGMRSVVESGDSVGVPGLGVIYPDFVQRNRTWTNPNTGQECTIGDKVRIKFRPSRSIERRLTAEYTGGNGVDYDEEHQQEEEQAEIR